MENDRGNSAAQAHEPESRQRDELRRRRLQEYLFGLEEIQERAEELAHEHEQLKRAQELLVAVLSGTVHGISLVENDRFSWCNQAMSDIFGWRQHELVGKQTRILYSGAEQHQAIVTRMEDQLNRSGWITFEHDFVNRMGVTMPCQVTARVLNKSDWSKGYVVSLTDITERKTAEEALYKAHEELELRVRERTDELVKANEKLTRQVEARKKAERDLRRQNEYLAGLHETTLGLISHLEVSDLLKAIVARAAGLLKTAHGFVYLKPENGDFLELKVGTGLYAEQVGYFLRIGEGLAGKVFEMEKPMIVDDYSVWEGRSPDRRWAEVESVVAVPLKSRSHVVGVFGLAHTARNLKFEHDEQQILSSFAELTSVALDNARLYAALQQELAQRIFTEEALSRSEEKFRSMVNQSTDCIYLLDPETKCVVDANPALLHLLGYNYQEFLGLSVYDFDASDRDDIDGRMARMAATRDHYLGQREYLTKDGRKVEVEVSANLISYGGDELLCLVCRDTTERKKLEQEIMKADKLESLGLLAGGIAHDFNNIMTAILGNISLVKMKGRPVDGTYKRLEEAEKACLRAKDLTQQLLTFSKGGAPIKETASVSDVIRESSGFILTGSSVGCRYEIPKDPWPVEIDTNQISLVIGNLVLNAKQAMPEGGSIGIVARNMIVEEGPWFPLPSGKYVRISIHDEGTGIPEKHLARIFDPYFTTKQTGSGLGLATSYSIIKKHDGHIQVESQLGVGTTFHIYLPVSDLEIEEHEKEKQLPKYGAGRILVMDDDELVREILEQILIELGYEAVTAADGRQTLKLYDQAKRSGEPFDAVIMDLTIVGGMGGKETIKEILKIDPSAAVIVSSGYSNDPVMSDFAHYGFKAMVTKPYNMEKLGDILHSVLEGKS